MLRRNPAFTCRLMVMTALALACAGAPARAEEPPASIHRAVRDDNTTALRRWLARDIRLLNQRDAEGMTPLHIAICRNRKRAFDFLIASGANVHLSTQRSFMKIDREDGTVAFRAPRADWTPLHLAAFANRLEMAKVLIVNGAKVDARNDRGETPLFLAAQEGHVGMIRLLIAHGANIEASPSAGKFTPLMAAAFNGHIEAGQMLVANGAHQDVRSAAALGFSAEVKMLLASDPASLNGDGTAMGSPLYWAALNGQVHIVRMLVDAGAKLEPKDAEMRTPLIVAAMNGHLAVVRMLAGHGAKVNEWDRRGLTALHHAALNNHPRVARILLVHQANPSAKDLRGRTPADLAKEAGHMDVVEAIMEGAGGDRAPATLMKGR